MHHPGDDEVMYSTRLRQIALALGTLGLGTIAGMFATSWALEWTPSPTVRGYAVLGTLALISVCLQLWSQSSDFAKRESWD